MGTSFVTIDNEHGFWMRDSVLQLWLRLLALHVEDPMDEDDVASKIRDQWLLASRHPFTGCVPHGLEEAIGMPHGATIVRSAVTSLLQALENGPGTLKSDLLNLLGFAGGAWTRDVEAARLIEVGKAFLDLLDGRIVWTARETSFMPGSE
jgi:hypothetical protein